MEPQNLEYQYYLAVAYVRLKKNREALEIFESLTAKDPVTYFKAYFDTAAIYSSEKKYEKALKPFEKPRKSTLRAAAFFLDMGYAYKDSGNYAKAIECFQSGKELDPS
jgi:tetratricopeptide (TPR) repeat protein